MPDGLQTLIARIDAAVQLRDPDRITQRIKHELQDAIRARTVSLPERVREVRRDGTCHVFEAAGGGRFVRRERALSYHE